MSLHILLLFKKKKLHIILNFNYKQFILDNLNLLIFFNLILCLKVWTKIIRDLEQLSISITHPKNT
jgi:hypothetical protein